MKDDGGYAANQIAAGPDGHGVSLGGEEIEQGPGNSSGDAAQQKGGNKGQV